MPTRTSQTHPLIITSVAPKDGGLIGMTLCPGKKQVGALSGDWERDLATDLRAVREWGAQAVITLMEEHELSHYEVHDIGTQTTAQGMEWYHLPIRDVHPPGRRFENRWILYGPKVHRILENRGQVLIHCRGGLGRTGTIAARLLVELGHSPRKAINTVREARTGAIETVEQEQHVCRIPVPFPDRTFTSRALGCLLGGAIGDAFGYAVEFDKLANIKSKFGHGGLQLPVLRDGFSAVSDDTQMTLFTLEGMNRAGTSASIEDILTAVHEAYEDWLETQGEQSPGYTPFGTLCSRQALHAKRAPGNTCLSALKLGGWGTPEEPINNSKGCGGVMRVAPLGWIDHVEMDVAFDLGARAAAMTHGHPDGWISAGWLTVLIWHLFNDKHVSRAIKFTSSFTSGKLENYALREKPRTLDLVQSAQALAESHRSKPVEAIKAIGEGWVGEEALAIAVYCVLSGSNFKDVIRRASNHDGDSDSTASIAGQIYGAWMGLDCLPMEWVGQIDVLDECLHGIKEVISLGHRAQETN
jgi:ADP-ribosyl-[dinitrogen reductase] hydrolase